MANRKQTSAEIARLAARTLADPKASKKNRTLAGSVLAQAAKPARQQRKEREARA